MNVNDGRRKRKTRKLLPLRRSAAQLLRTVHLGPVENFTPPALLNTTEPRRTTASGNLGGEADRLVLAYTVEILDVWSRFRCL
jgi:hypothetical protein